jgi:hypothetical protein
LPFTEEEETSGWRGGTQEEEEEKEAKGSGINIFLLFADLFSSLDVVWENQCACNNRSQSRLFMILLLAPNIVVLHYYCYNCS